MSFDEKTIKTVANLARLKLPETEESKLRSDVEDILAWVEQLKEVDVMGVEPLVSVTPRETAVRKDVVSDGNIQEELMANAPETVQGFYVVPRMVE